MFDSQGKRSWFWKGTEHHSKCPGSSPTWSRSPRLPVCTPGGSPTQIQAAAGLERRLDTDGGATVRTIQPGRLWSPRLNERGCHWGTQPRHEPGTKGHGETVQGQRRHFLLQAMGQLLCLGTSEPAGDLQVLSESPWPGLENHGSWGHPLEGRMSIIWLLLVYGL